MKNERIYQSIIYLTSVVWFVNGLFCKVLNLVPRHEQIVGRILSQEYSRPLTFMIGMSEIVMALWVLMPKNRRFTTMVQITIVASMNILEYLLVPDLLLWGRFNALFALIFIIVIYTNEFHIKDRTIQTT